MAVLFFFFLQNAIIVFLCCVYLYSLLMNGQVHKWFSNGGSDRKPLTPRQVCLHPIQQDILLLHDPR